MAERRSYEIGDHPEHTSPLQFAAEILDIKVRVDLLRGLHRPVRDQLADHIERHAATAAQGRIRVPEPMRGEVEADLPPGAQHDVVDLTVA